MIVDGNLENLVTEEMEEKKNVGGWGVFGEYSPL